MSNFFNPSISFIQDKVALLRKFYPGHEIVCAGGAVRDILCNKPVKDLDFFLEGDASTLFRHSNLYSELCQELNHGCHTRDHVVLDMNKVSSNTKYGGYGSSELFVVEFPCGWRNYPIQLVFLPEGNVRKEVFEKFDFGLTRVYCDERGVRAHPTFYHDQLNRRLTYYGSGWGCTSPERIARLREKYSDYRFVNKSGERLA